MRDFCFCPDARYCDLALTAPVRGGRHHLWWSRQSGVGDGDPDEKEASNVAVMTLGEGNSLLSVIVIGMMILSFGIVGACIVGDSKTSPRAASLGNTESRSLPVAIAHWTKSQRFCAAAWLRI